MALNLIFYKACRSHVTYEPRPYPKCLVELLERPFQESKIGHILFCFFPVDFNFMLTMITSEDDLMSRLKRSVQICSNVDSIFAFAPNEKGPHF